MSEATLTTPLPIEPLAVPLRRLENGAYRVADTRIPLELVIHAFDAGRSPEDIVRSWRSLALSDVYAVVAYYLTHREAVQRYIHETEKEVEALWKEIDANQPPGRPSGAELRARYERMMREKNAAPRE
jgi:uncharacterized protein (DUF433 family)